MLTNENVSDVEKKPTIAATMFGVTTPCVNAAREYLEAKGYEVLTFHATGMGGRCMEDLIRSGFIKGVLDITTTEWCDELFGGVFTAGPRRSEAAGLCGVPQVVSVGAMDMVNFHAMQCTKNTLVKQDRVDLRMGGRHIWSLYRRLLHRSAWSGAWPLLCRMQHT